MSATGGTAGAGAGTGTGASASPTYRALLEELARRGLAPRFAGEGAAWTGAAQALAREAEERPHVAARILVGAGTWVGALLIALVVGLSGIANAAGGGLVLGVALFAGAAGAARNLRGDFGQQATVALLAGAEALIFVAFADGFRVHDRALLVVLLGLQGAAIAAVPDALVRYLSAGIGTVVAGFLAREMQVHDAVDAVAALAGLYVLVAFLYESRLASTRLAAVARPVAFGLATGVVILLSDPEGGSAWRDRAESFLGLAPVATIAFAGLFVVVAGQALVELGRPYSSAPGKIAAAGALLVAVLTLGTPGILASLFLLALAQLRGERLLSAFALLALGWFLFLAFSHLRAGPIPLSLAVGGTGAALLALAWRAIPSAPRPPSPA